MPMLPLETSLHQPADGTWLPQSSSAGSLLYRAANTLQHASWKSFIVHNLACRVDMVLVGAEGVVESGGIINKLGTHHIAIAAKAQGIPFYVAAESYKVGLHSPCGVQQP